MPNTDMSTMHISKGLNFQGANDIVFQQFSTYKVLIENTALFVWYQALFLPKLLIVEDLGLTFDDKVEMVLARLFLKKQ